MGEGRSSTPKVVVYEGCFVPRYKRNKSPGDEAQPERWSVDVDKLSNDSSARRWTCTMNRTSFLHKEPRLYCFDLQASLQHMCQSVAKFTWIFRTISFQDPRLVEQQMRDVLLE